VRRRHAVTEKSWWAVALGTLVVLVALGDRLRHLLVGGAPLPSSPG